MPESDAVPEPLERTLALAAGGDEQAWRRLVAEYGRRVYGLLLRQCGDRDLAEELTQATFVKVAGTLGREGGYEERGQFEPWLFRIAINALRDEMRRRGRQARSVDMSPAAQVASGAESDALHAAAHQAMAHRAAERAAADDPAARIDRGELVQRLRAAVETLSEPEQRVLHLRHTAGLSFAEIAQTLGEPLGTVLARSHRALGKLRKRLEEVEDGV